MGGKSKKVILLMIAIISLSKDNSYHTLKNHNTYINNLKAIQQLYNNKDIIGRLEIPYLFNIYIVQGNNNEYYLSHNIEKNDDIRGTPFLDYRTNYNNNRLIIYGHNSNTISVPFHHLIKFLDESFYNKNNIIYLETSSSLRTYLIFCIKEVSNILEYLNFQEDTISYINKLLENAIYTRNFSYNNDSEILLLQTCSLNDTYYIIGSIRL